MGEQAVSLAKSVEYTSAGKAATLYVLAKKSYSNRPPKGMQTFHLTVKKCGPKKTVIIMAFVGPNFTKINEFIKQ